MVDYRLDNALKDLSYSEFQDKYHYIPLEFLQMISSGLNVTKTTFEIKNWRQGLTKLPANFKAQLR